MCCTICGCDTSSSKGKAVLHSAVTPLSLLATSPSLFMMDMQRIFWKLTGCLFLGLLGTASVLGWQFYHKLEDAAVTRFSDHRWAVPSKVYARPLLSFTPDSMLKRLLSLTIWHAWIINRSNIPFVLGETIGATPKAEKFRFFYENLCTLDKNALPDEFCCP